MTCCSGAAIQPRWRAITRTMRHALRRQMKCRSGSCQCLPYASGNSMGGGGEQVVHRVAATAALSLLKSRRQRISEVLECNCTNLHQDGVFCT